MNFHLHNTLCTLSEWNLSYKGLYLDYQHAQHDWCHTRRRICLPLITYCDHPWFKCGPCCTHVACVAVFYFYFVYVCLSFDCFLIFSHDIAVSFEFEFELSLNIFKLLQAIGNVVLFAKDVCGHLRNTYICYNNFRYVFPYNPKHMNHL